MANANAPVDVNPPAAPVSAPDFDSEASRPPPSVPEKLIRVAVIMPLAEQRGGGELMVVHLIEAGRAMGVAWMVIFLNDGPMVQTVRDFGVDAVVIRSGKMRNIPRLLLTARRIADLARRERIDLIVGWMGTGHLYGGMASIFSGIPAIWYQLGIPLDRGFIDRMASRLPARLILTCSETGARAQKALSPHRAVRTVYPAVELDRFDPAALPTPSEARQKLGLPADGPLIGIVGRLQRWKGMHVLIDAFPAILARYPDARLLIVGGAHAFEPDYPAFLNGRIVANGVEKCVILAGLQSNVQEWAQAMDIFVHASDNEPFGIVVIEGMALGKAVIATDTAGPTEIITPSVNGLLVPYGDSAALAGAVLRYLDDPEFAAQNAAQARARALEFSTTRYAENVVRACRDALVAANEAIIAR
jgi:glycosyltransferase involved in cell wall biosynthesis